MQALDSDTRTASSTKVILGLSLFVVAAVAVVLYVVPHPPPAGAGVAAAVPLPIGPQSPRVPDALATVNAALNASSALALMTGFFAVKRRRIELHRLCMGTSFVLSSVFLVTYLVHHARVGSVKFQGAASLRLVYFAILVPHVLLAAAIVPLALTTLHRGLVRDVPRHRKIARVTLPLWLYVSVSGVLLYFMLYHLA